METLHHISLFKPGEGSGGVERFAAYLKQAIPELECLSLSDYPGKDAAMAEHLPDYDLAKYMNEWLVRTGALNKESVVIVDGYWGLGLQGKVKRLISVCHGSYWGRFVQAQISSWGEVVDYTHVDAQTEMWESPDVEIVAVSKESKREILDSCNPSSEPVVIYHGVDTDILSPMDSDSKVWMHAAVSNRKGADIINSLVVEHNIRCELMGKCPTLEDKAKRFADAVVLIAPTRHEGNSYVLLEALSCGVPVITYHTGLAQEFDERCGIVTDDLAPENFARLIRGFRPENYDPRAWVKENCGPANFAANWRNFLVYK